MAIVKAPALSLSASGNMGDICYSTWRGMAIARSTWSGTVPNTTKQLEQQSKLTTVSQAWGGILTEANRLTWRMRAQTIIWSNRLGDPYKPSGYQLFMKWNIRRLVMGLALMEDAPGEQEWVPISVFNVNVGATNDHIRMRLNKPAGGHIDGYGEEFYKAGPYDSGGRHPIDGEWLFLERKTPPNIYKDYDVDLDKWYWYRGRQITRYGDVGNWWEKQMQFKI